MTTIQTNNDAARDAGQTPALDAIYAPAAKADRHIAAFLKRLQETLFEVEGSLSFPNTNPLIKTVRGLRNEIQSVRSASAQMFTLAERSAKVNKLKLIEGNTATTWVMYSYGAHVITGRSGASSSDPYKRGRRWTITTLGRSAKSLADAKKIIDALA